MPVRLSGERQMASEALGPLELCLGLTTGGSRRTGHQGPGARMCGYLQEVGQEAGVVGWWGWGWGRRGQWLLQAVSLGAQSPWHHVRIWLQEGPGAGQPSGPASQPPRSPDGRQPSRPASQAPWNPAASQPGGPASQLPGSPGGGRGGTHTKGQLLVQRIVGQVVQGHRRGKGWARRRGGVGEAAQGGLVPTQVHVVVEPL